MSAESPTPDALEKDPPECAREAAGAKDEACAAQEVIDQEENADRAGDPAGSRQERASGDDRSSAGDGAPSFDEEAAKARYRDIAYDQCRDDHPDGAPLFADDELEVLKTKITPKVPKKTKERKKELQTRHSRWVARMVERDRERAAREWKDGISRAREQQQKKRVFEFTGREPWEFISSAAAYIAIHADRLPGRLAHLRPRARAMAAFVLCEEEIAALAPPTQELALKYGWLLDWKPPAEILVPIMVAIGSIPHLLLYDKLLDDAKAAEARPVEARVIS